MTIETTDQSNEVESTKRALSILNKAIGLRESTVHPAAGEIEDTTQYIRIRLDELTELLRSEIWSINSATRTHGRAERFADKAVKHFLRHRDLAFDTPDRSLEETEKLLEAAKVLYDELCEKCGLAETSETYMEIPTGIDPEELVAIRQNLFRNSISTKRVFESYLYLLTPMKQEEFITGMLKLYRVLESYSFPNFRELYFDDSSQAGIRFEGFDKAALRPDQALIDLAFDSEAAMREKIRIMFCHTEHLPVK